jgi:hypothetical protein
MNEYSRPYCKNCKLIWGRYNIGFVLKCDKCGQPLILKSFNPWSKIIGGIFIIILGILTLLIPDIPIIWIGGFIAGGLIINNALSQWEKIKEIDKKSKNF